MTTIKIALKEEIKKQIYIYIFTRNIYTYIQYVYYQCNMSILN